MLSKTYSFSLKKMYHLYRVKEKLACWWKRKVRFYINSQSLSICRKVSLFFGNHVGYGICLLIFFSIFDCHWRTVKIKMVISWQQFMGPILCSYSVFLVKKLRKKFTKINKQNGQWPPKDLNAIKIVAYIFFS